MSWLGWIALYLAVGVITGEAGRKSQEILGDSITKTQYLVCVFLWWVVWPMSIRVAYRQRKGKK